MSTAIDGGGLTAGIASVKPSAASQRPFVERRKSDRRQQDRRQRDVWVRTDLLASNDASHCTTREQQILLLLLQGMTNKEIAQRLGIVEDTVKKHLQHVYSKFGVRRRALIILRGAGAARPERSAFRRTTLVE